MCKHGNAVTLKLPVNINVEKSARSISCDECIVEVMELLWERDIQTLGYWCGHGNGKPSIVVHESYGSQSIAAIKEIIAEVDDRDLNRIAAG